MTLRVLVVDDQALVRRGFAMVLDHQPDITVVGEASDGLEAIEMASQQQPDVILMDIRMPRLDGLDATKRILAAVDNRARVIVLTTFDPDEYIYGALRAGASGFLLKDIPPEDLVDAVRTVADGGALLSPEITQRLIGRFAAQQTADSTLTARLGRLTDRELEVLRCVGGGLSNQEIAERLTIGGTTVKTHVSSILSKLGLRDRAQAVVFAYESGLARAGDHPIGH